MKTRILACVILLFLSCRSTSNIDDCEYIIPVDVNDVVDLSIKNFEILKFIPLETKENSLLGEIMKIYMTENSIVVFDLNNEITLFDLDGIFIRKIGKKGRGPGEYIYFADVVFNEKDNFIYAYDSPKNLMHIYNTKGELIEMYEFSTYSFYSFWKTSYGTWIYNISTKNNPDKYNLMLIDSDRKKAKGEYFSQNSFLFASSNTTFLDDQNDDIFYVHPYGNVVYHLKENQVTPFLKVDLGKKTIPYYEVMKMTHEDEYELLIANKKYLGDLSNFFFCGDKFYCSFKETGFYVAVQSYNLIYDLKTKECIISQNPFFIESDYPISTRIVGKHQDSLIYLMQPHFFSEDSFEYLKDKFSVDFDENSNPIIVIMKNIK